MKKVHYCSMFKWCGVLLCFFCFCVPVSAQIDFKKNSTEKLAVNPDLIPEQYHKPKRLLSIFTSDTKSILYGNPCMDAVTVRFGYEYVVMPNNAQGYSGANKAVHNFGVKFLLFFRNPFWKVISKKKAIDCRQKTGDYNG
ncbi:MAG: hypothetical protein ACJAT1_001989 [Marivirga sp.]|jgi:hypothetical protein